MSLEKALGLVVQTTDWSESSRIVTLWTRELGRVRALAKGGRRLKSSFESALDLLSVCRIVLLRKSSESLDLLTEAQVAERFPHLSKDLPALYAGYYVAELLSGWTEDYDPHPRIFDEALATLRVLGNPPSATGLRLLRFELVLLHELGYRPVLDQCAACGCPLNDVGMVPRLAFSPEAGGMLCPACPATARDRLFLSRAGWQALRLLNAEDAAWRQDWPATVRQELRQVLNHYVTYLMGRRPRLLPYLGG
ncbi:MAG: DNA repair protein RecO [Gemmataceae bacterium]